MKLHVSVHFLCMFNNLKLGEKGRKEKGKRNKEMKKERRGKKRKKEGKKKEKGKRKKEKEGRKGKGEGEGEGKGRRKARKGIRIGKGKGRKISLHSSLCCWGKRLASANSVIKMLVEMLSLFSKRFLSCHFQDYSVNRTLLYYHCNSNYFKVGSLVLINIYEHTSIEVKQYKALKYFVIAMYLSTLRVLKALFISISAAK